MASLVVAIALWYGLRYYYGIIVAKPGAHLLHVVADGPPADEILEIRDGEFFLNTFLERTPGARDFRRVRLPLHEVYWNLILLFLLTAITPPRRLLRRWWAVLVAYGLLWATHVGFFAWSVYAQLGRLYLQEGQGEETFGSREWIEFLGQTSRVYSAVFAALMPAVVLLPVWIGRLRRRRIRPLAATAEDRARPNEPCPCGSGRKFKRCCGSRR